MTAITVLNWKPVAADRLRGFCDAQLPSGMVLHEISIMRGKDGGFWASPPGKPMLSRDGHVMLDNNGRRRYTPCVSFADASIKRRFSAGVIEALRVAFPEALLTAADEPIASAPSPAWNDGDEAPF